MSLYIKKSVVADIEYFQDTTEELDFLCLPAKICHVM